MQQSTTGHASWRELLASPAPGSHIAQIYEREDFLAAGVSLFAAEGIRRGEVVLLVGTRPHLLAVRRALAAHGVDADAAIREKQLSVSDVHEAIAAMAAGGVPQAPQSPGARWWGEISNVLHLAGDTRAALAAEDLADAAAKKHRLSVLCSYLLDRFDPEGYDGMLRQVCAKHSHVIPAEDYVRHRLAVNRALAEVVGEIKGPLLQSLLSWKGLACDLPSSQALLFWVRDTLPEHFHDVLSRARAYQLQEPA